MGAAPKNNHIPQYDVVYIKYKRKRGVMWYPLCEVLDGRYDKDYSMILNGKPKQYTRQLLLEELQTTLDVGEILDFAIQKAGTNPPDSVVTLLIKYK